MSPAIKRGLIIAAKHAVNAALLSLYPVYQAPAQFNLHTKIGFEHILSMVGFAVLTREGIIWIPKLLKWSQTDVELNGGSPNA